MTAEALCAAFRQALAEGWGYIWGASGQRWTEQRQRAAADAETVRWGRQWIGRQVADCSGLFVWAFRQQGERIYHGSNTIWLRHCRAKGKLTPGQTLRPGTAVFLLRGGRRTHIGLYVGDDTCIEARSTRDGVVTSPLRHWDEWGELSQVTYEGEEIMTEVLKTGCAGEQVRQLQQTLNALGWACGSADGVYGAKTAAAVRAFQRAHGLREDGAAGPETRAVLLRAAEEESLPGLRKRVAALEARLERAGL